MLGNLPMVCIWISQCRSVQHTRKPSSLTTYAWRLRAHVTFDLRPCERLADVCSSPREGDRTASRTIVYCLSKARRREVYYLLLPTSSTRCCQLPGLRSLLRRTRAGPRPRTSIAPLALQGRRHARICRFLRSGFSCSRGRSPRTQEVCGLVQARIESTVGKQPNREHC